MIEYDDLVDTILAMPAARQQQAASRSCSRKTTQSFDSNYETPVVFSLNRALLLEMRHS